MKPPVLICLLLVACTSEGRDADASELTRQGELAHSEPTLDDRLPQRGAMDGAELMCSARPSLATSQPRTAGRKRPPQPERCTDSRSAE